MDDFGVRILAIVSGLLMMRLDCLRNGKTPVAVAMDLIIIAGTMVFGIKTQILIAKLCAKINYIHTDRGEAVTGNLVIGQPDMA